MKLLSILAITAFIVVSCQSNKTSNLTFLSEPIPTDEPLVFGEGVISTISKEFSITFNPQMDEMFFTRRRQGAKNEIYTMKLVEGKWSEPELAFFATNTGWDFEPHINPKGDKLYFGSTRPLNDTVKASGMHQWVSEKNGNGWGQPKPLGTPFVNRFVMYPSASDDETLYFTSREEGVDREDSSIFFSIKEGDQYTTVKNMADRITLPGKWIAHPYIAPDESYLIFDSQKDSESGDCDLYIAFNENGTWTEPYNLGPKINTAQCEMCASVSPDGKYLFFHRGGKGKGDMYWVDFLKLKKEINKKVTASLEGLYLNQKPPGLVPEPFAPGLVTTDGWEVSGVFTPNLKEFYFIKRGEEPKSQNLVVFRYKEGEWQESVVAPRKGTPFISPDGEIMHLGRQYRERTESGNWSDLKLLDSIFQDIKIMRLTASWQSTYVFDELGMPNGDGVIRYSRLIDGQREVPQDFGKEINTGRMNAHPFIAPDESYLIWDGEREAGFGDSDLYISFRQKDGSWGEAINMGKEINTAGWEAVACVTPDGKYLFFNRNENPENYNSVDIYWVDSGVIERLRPQ